MRKTGQYRKLGDLEYFIPFALPPKSPELVIDSDIMVLYGKASFALGQLNEMTARLPNTERFIKAYVMKEALLSSAIEGINTTLIDAFTQKIGASKPNNDTQLVLNYTNALNDALQLMDDENLPLINRVILKAHHTLLSGADDHSNPGNFRQQSVQVSDLIPPPAPEIPMLMGGLENYINEVSDLPNLIKVGLAHVHFETIHPFLDGNGRIGRLMIVLMLLEYGILREPILYISYYLKKNHLEYYQRLDGVRTKGDFEGWIKFYLEAIFKSAEDAHKRAKEIENLETALKEKIQTTDGLSKINALLVLDSLFTNPIVGISELSKVLKKSFNTIDKIVNVFVEIGILELQENQKRNKLYQFTGYINLLNREY